MLQPWRYLGLCPSESTLELIPRVPDCVQQLVIVGSIWSFGRELQAPLLPLNPQKRGPLELDQGINELEENTGGSWQ